MERQAYLRPSSAATWSKCAGYAALNAALGAPYVEETDNDIREDGTACHWLAAELWEGRQVIPGTLSPNGRELTDEMFAAVEEYHALLRSWPHPPTLEVTVPVSRHFPGVSDGTPDAWSFNGYRLDVGDFKYGFRAVDVWRNAQLIVYAWTLVCELTAGGDAPQEVVLHICQPRCPHRDGTTRSWTVSIPILAELAAKLAAAARECYAPAPMCTAGPQCRDCGAAFGCATLQAAAASAMEIAYDATPLVLTEPQLGYELAKLMAAQQHIENRITGLSTQAESLLRHGKRVPGFEMGRAATRWRWREGIEPVLLRLGQLFNVDVMQPAKVKSVAKLRDAFPIPVQDMYAEKPAGELKLRLSDPNEAVRRLGKS